jgi:hypothetical protein
LAEARLRELDPATLRAIAIVEAMGSDAVRILLLDDGPIDGRVAGTLLPLLRARAAAGAAVLVAASECGTIDDPASEFVHPSANRIRVDTPDPLTLAKALAKCAAIHVEQSGRSTVWIGGPSMVEALGAVEQAIADTRVPVDRLEAAP